jgi:hypothetical protein
MRRERGEEREFSELVVVEDDDDEEEQEGEV